MKKFKNNELEILRNQLDAVLDCRLQTKLSIAITKLITNISDAYFIYQEARKSIIESYAKKDENGSFEFITKEVAGKVIQEYIFNSLEEKAECMIKCEEAGKTDVEIIVPPIAEADIEKETNLTPAQVMALFILVPETKVKK